MQELRSKKARISRTLRAAEVAEHLGHVVADLSQSHSRRPYNRGPVLRTLTTSSDLWAFAQQRFLSAREHLLLQGYSPAVTIPEEVSERDLKQIAGECIALPPLAVVLWSVFLAGKMCV